MKLLEGLVKFVLWVAFIVACFMLGWMLRAYKERKENK